MLQLEHKKEISINLAFILDETIFQPALTSFYFPLTNLTSHSESFL